MKNFFLSLFMAVVSLFDFHHQTQPVVSTDIIASSTVSIEPNVSTSSSISIKTLPIVSKLPFDTTGWQTYQDNTYGIQLEYPKEWSLSSSTSKNVPNTNIILNKNGYILNINMCNATYCMAAADEQTYTQNITLSSSRTVDFNINNNKAWRTVRPEPNGEDDPTLYFNFIFFRKAMSSANQSAYNDSSKFTPISDSISNNGIAYRVSYQLPSTVSVSTYDQSIINQMDEIVQTITLSKK